MIKVFFFIGFVVTVAMASCECGNELTTKPDCGCGMKPKDLCGKAGAFCGRGPNRKDCCKGYTCEIAPNDSSAYCVKEKKPKCGKHGALCAGVGVTSKCCEGFHCIYPPMGPHGYCDSIANPTCAKQGETCGTVGTKTIFCCENLVCNSSYRPNEPPFCDGWSTIG